MSNKLDASDVKTLVTVGIVLAVVIAAVYAFKKLLGNIPGFGSDEEADKAKTDVAAAVANAAKSTSPWSPQYYKNAPAGVHILTVAGTDAANKDIADSVGYFKFFDDPDQAYGGVKQFPTKAALSFGVDRFQKTYARDMLTYLQTSFTNDRDLKVLTQILSYANSLPSY